MNAFSTLQFGYCPLVWMIHGWTLNNRITELQQKTLRFVYNDSGSSFSDLLKKGNSLAIHHQKIQKLDIKVYKVKHHE